MAAEGVFFPAASFSFYLSGPKSLYKRISLPSCFNIHSKTFGSLRISLPVLLSPRCLSTNYELHSLNSWEPEEPYPQSSLPQEESEPENSYNEDNFIDIKLPRRRLLVQFTCDACGERTERTINRLAYERGTVFVQCAGCLQHHKLVDNLGLVVEYDLRDDDTSDQHG